VSRRENGLIISNEDGSKVCFPFLPKTPACFSSKRNFSTGYPAAFVAEWRANEVIQHKRINAEQGRGERDFQTDHLTFILPTTTHEGTAGLSRCVRAKPPTTWLERQKNRTGPTFLKTLCRLYLKGDKDEKGNKMFDRYKMMRILLISLSSATSSALCFLVTANVGDVGGEHKGRSTKDVAPRRQD